MGHSVATVRDVIKALQKFPMDTPVFGYAGGDDECDFPIDIVELCQNPRQPDEEEFECEEDREWWERWHPVGLSPFYCQGDSCIEQFWINNGVQPVVVLRPRDWIDAEIEEESK